MCARCAAPCPCRATQRAVALRRFMSLPCGASCSNIRIRGDYGRACETFFFAHRYDWRRRGESCILRQRGCASRKDCAYVTQLQFKVNPSSVCGVHRDNFSPMCHRVWTWFRSCCPPGGLRPEHATVQEPGFGGRGSCQGSPLKDDDGGEILAAFHGSR